MNLYRLSKEKYAGDRTGEGSRKAGGRWNLKGTPVIYTADSTALAALENLVHFNINLMPKKYYLTTFKLPENVKIDSITISKLSNNWRNYPAPNALAQLGTEWANKNKTAVLKVPSSILPDEGGWNYLLNPNHEDFAKIKIIKISSFEFDQRFFK